VLASSATAAAAEDLLAAFRAANRGAIIGEPTGGSPGDVATFRRCPRAGACQFSVTRHEAPDGTGFRRCRREASPGRDTDGERPARGETSPRLEKAWQYLKGGLPLPAALVLGQILPEEPDDRPPLRCRRLPALSTRRARKPWRTPGYTVWRKVLWYVRIAASTSAKPALMRASFLGVIRQAPSHGCARWKWPRGWARSRRRKRRRDGGCLVAYRKLWPPPQQKPDDAHPRSGRAALIRLTYATVASRSCVSVSGSSPRSACGRRRWTAACRPRRDRQIGSDRGQSRLVASCSWLCPDEVRHPEDLMDHPRRPAPDPCARDRRGRR